jgi:lipid-A-disaccharide synthase-like uncharacterized protein
MDTLTWQEITWLGIGFAGQACFSARFAWQWLYSERAGRSLIPKGFWYLSLLGAAALLSYSLYRMDPVFILGQTFGFIVYIRNLQLIARAERSL